MASTKKVLVGEGDWTYVEKVLVRTIGMEAGTFTLPEHKLWELMNLVGIPAT